MAVSGKQAFEVTDFSGGISDDVFSGQTNTAYQLDNFLISSDKKLESRGGSEIDDPQSTPIPSGYSRVGEMINHARNTDLLVQSGNNIVVRPNSDTQTGGWETLLGPSGNPVFNGNSANNFISHAQWNRHTFVTTDSFSPPQKIYKDQSGNYVVVNAGLPALSSTPTATVGATGSQSFLYFFHYIYTYQVGTQTFTDLGPTTEIQVLGSADPSVSPITINNIPTLTPGPTDNLDLNNIQLVLYRTTNNGVNAYKLTSLYNGVTSYTDNNPDSAIQSNLQLYTNDGTLDFLPAPASKFIHVVKNAAFYAWTSDQYGTHPNRFYQSVIGNPAAVPGLFFVEVEDEIMGLSSVNGLPMLFCKKIIYRLDGLFTQTGTGGVTPVELHRSAGCIAAGSIVEAENRVFWAGADGFYCSDGYQVFKISDHLNVRYKQILTNQANPLRIRARYDETKRLVYWALQSAASSLDNDSLFVLDLKWGVSTTSTFTTFSGPSFRPTAIEMFRGALIRGDTNGFVFRHDDTASTDPKVSTTLSPQSWSQETIKWSYVSNHYNFKGSFFRKMVSRILLQAENAGNTTIQITAVNDQGKKVRPLKLIRWRRNFSWGDPSFVWGNQDCVWNSTGLIEQWRRMPAGGLRLSYLQIQITNGLGIISNSDSDGLCTVNSFSKQIVLPSLWPSDSVDYYLTFANDNYTREFQVQSINGSLDTVVVLDPQNLLPPSGQYEWELMGYQKGEPLNLIGYNLHWDNIDQNQNTYSAGDSGANS